MHKKPIIYAMIPARAGSTRLKLKNLALLNGKPIIYYAIQAAKESRVFNRVIVNSDHEVFGKIAERYEVDYYQRPEALGSSETKSDEVVVDFMRACPEADIVVWVNPISPFQSGSEVARVVNYFLGKKLDSLITVETKQVHTVWNDKPVNYDPNVPFLLTQDIVPVQVFVYSVMMWRVKTFLKEHENCGYAFFCGKFGVFPVSRMTSIIIKTEEDLIFADQLMQNLNKKQSLKYDSIIDSI